jgi:hypothetical protein
MYLALLVPSMFRQYVLLHDAHEAYIGDINTPFKNHIKQNWPGYQDFINSIDQAIIAALKLDYKKFLYVKEVLKDKEAEMFNVEVALLHDQKIINFEGDHPLYGAPWGMEPSAAENTFLNVWKLHA